MKPRCIGRRRWRLLGSLAAAGILLGAPAAGAEQQGATTGPSTPAATPAPTESQREAAALLQGMVDYLVGLQSFSVSFRAGYDVVQSTGQKVEFGETRRVTLARPDRLRMEKVTSENGRDLVIFDGRTISVLNADEGVYAQAPQPGSVDESLVYFVRSLRMRMPLAVLLTTRLPEVLPGRVRSVDYVESTEILGVPTHHIAGRGENVDFQFWITEGAQPLPRRVVITYVQSPGQPQFWANFADWNTSPQLPTNAFEFSPPKNGRRIPFAVQLARPAETPPPPAASGEVQP
jgi:hypothetical protein